MPNGVACPGSQEDAPTPQRTRCPPEASEDPHPLLAACTLGWTGQVAVRSWGSRRKPRWGRPTGSRNMVAPEVLICNFHFARNGDFFFFKKHWTSLNFRPFTNIFLGQKRRKKNPTKCLSQLLTSTMNHGHKTTAMWLTKKLCVFTSRYWKSCSNLRYVICRQTDGCTDTPLWVLSRQSYNHGHWMTLHFTHFPFLILFWKITLQGLNLPP